MDATHDNPPQSQGQPTPPESLPKFYNLLIQAASAAVLAAFALYSIGYIIWHSYLSTYGVSSVVFVQAEYVAAAFCYLIISVVLALPPAILFEHERATRAGKKPQPESIKVLQAVWFLILIWIQAVFFPLKQGSPPTSFLYLVGFGFLWATLYVLSALKWPQARFTKLLRLNDVKFNLLLIAVAISLLSGTDLSIWFLFYTLFLYPIYVYLPGINNPAPEAWAKSNLPVRVVLLGLTVLLLLIHIQLFGKTVFGLIPKTVGGGKPEKAFIHLAPQHASLAAALNFSTTNQPFLTNGVVGPVGIILQSEHEIIFVDYAQVVASDALTNIVTNAVQRFTTNKSQVIFTNTAFTIATNVVKNPLKAQRAKQVRADVVDAVVFSE